MALAPPRAASAAKRGLALVNTTRSRWFMRSSASSRLFSFPLPNHHLVSPSLCSVNGVCQASPSRLQLSFKPL